MSEVELEQAVQVTYAGRRYTFRIDHDPPLKFWRVEVQGEVHRLPLPVHGDEEPAFFNVIAKQIAEGRAP